MKTLTLKNGNQFPVKKVHTLIVGSGAAGLNCADRLHQQGITDLLIVTEHLGAGTSNNSGSDKQTYYKLGMAASVADSPWDMAHSLFDGGSMHGDIALIESLVSPEAFYHLVSIGVPFPNTVYGGYTGYKTDHDPRQRGTSAGPYTSKMMYQKLLKEVRRREIPILENHDVIALLSDRTRCYGALVIDKKNLDTESKGISAVFAENVVYGTGGPGGLFKASVFPTGQYGGIGLALEAGAEASNLTESQFGLASIKFRWNVSGTYQQVIPRYISTDREGGDEQEFLKPWFSSSSKMNSAIFLKGYQWPFDPRKIDGEGSSLIDILVYIETAVKGRRVYMDFRRNPTNDKGENCLDIPSLNEEARSYLENSGAEQKTPIERLDHMNPLAIALYDDHNIDIRTEPLEIAVCAQHNNGGLHGDVNWESVNLKHLFPVGEVSGTHGVYRPGGSALNSGQVGGIRASEHIACVYPEWTASDAVFTDLAEKKLELLLSQLESAETLGTVPMNDFRNEYQERMTISASHIRESRSVSDALEAAYDQVKHIENMQISNAADIPGFFRNRQLAIAYAAYIEAIRFYLEKGGRSRGSYLVLDNNGSSVHPDLDRKWSYTLEDGAVKDNVLVTAYNDASGRFESNFISRRALPDDDFWFETIWQEYRTRRG